MNPNLIEQIFSTESSLSSLPSLFEQISEIDSQRLDTVFKHMERINPIEADMVELHHKESMRLFERLISSGVCREQARGVLPQNLYTRYYGTVNLNNLLKFIDLRLHEGAQWEIQQVAKGCLDIATELWPFTVGAYRELRHEV